MMLKILLSPIVLILFLITFTGNSYSQSSLNDKVFSGQLFKDEITRAYLYPSKIIWQSDTLGMNVISPEVLLSPYKGQLTTSSEGMSVLKSDSNMIASVLLDYGKELYGGIEISAGIRSDKIRLKLESDLGISDRGYE